MSTSADDDWELCPENGHPVARTLLVPEFYWNCADDDSPLGNDTGADTFAFFQKELGQDPSLDVAAFLRELLSSWDMDFEDWNELDPKRIASMLTAAPFTVSTADDAVIALAFGMFIVTGRVDIRIRDWAKQATIREELDVMMKDRGWVSPDERLLRLKDMRSKLDLMPT